MTCATPSGVSRSSAEREADMTEPRFIRSLCFVENTMSRAVVVG